MGCGIYLCLNSLVEFVTREKLSPNFRPYRFSFHCDMLDGHYSK